MMSQNDELPSTFPSTGEPPAVRGSYHSEPSVELQAVFPVKPS
jgi:hypothetical protein